MNTCLSKPLGDTPLRTQHIRPAKPAFTTALLLAATLTGSSLFASSAFARIRLVTLPVREHVSVQLDHPNATLVEEERIVPLIQGTNHIDFSWANTNINPNTIVLRVLGPGDDAKANGFDANILAVNYPPNEQALSWEVSANVSGSARVKISYILGGLEQTTAYRAVASADESTLELRQYVRIHNFAQETFGDVTLNLGPNQSVERPLSSNETRELLVDTFAGIPIEKTYTCNPAEFGYSDRAKNRLAVPMHYVIENDQDHGLGKAAMPMGKVRIFQEDSRGTRAFIGEDWGQATARNQSMQLAIGQAQDVIVERKIMSHDRHSLGANMHRHEVVIQYEIQNTKDQAVTLNVLETIPQLMGETGIPQNQAPSWHLGNKTTLPTTLDEKTDLYTAACQVKLEARKGQEADKQTFVMHVVFDDVF